MKTCKQQIKNIHDSFLKESIQLYRNFHYTDIHGDKIATVGLWPGEGDGYKHCHIYSPKLKKIALHLNVPAYYIHDDSRGTFKNRKQLIDFVRWLDSDSGVSKLTWWEYLVFMWNNSKETQKNTKLRIKTTIRPPYEKGIYKSYQDCIKHEPKYLKW